MACKVLGSICLRVGEKKPYGIDLTSFCAKTWASGEVYSAGERVRPRGVADGGRGPTGFEYECTSGGASSVKEPSWPTTIGQTVVDGGVTWTCRAISNDSLAMTISASTWEVPSQLTASGATTETTGGEQKTASYLEATAVLSRGLVVNNVVFSDGREERFGLKVNIRAASAT